jgi:hypothetical protein
MKNKILLGIKIEATDEYYNAVQNKWFRVPPHWVGLRTSEISDKIFREGASEFVSV